MQNSFTARKIISGYWRDVTKLIIEALVNIIIKYVVIPEYFVNYGDGMRCIENNFTLVYDWENLEERLQYQNTTPWAFSSHWAQSAYGHVKLDPCSLNAHWLFEYALPQSHTQICCIGITNCNTLSNTNPGKFTNDYFSHRPKWRYDDIYLGFEFAPRQRTKYEMFIEKNRNKFTIKEILYSKRRYRPNDRRKMGDYPDPKPVGDYLFGDLCFSVKYDNMHNMIIAQINFRSWPTNCVSDSYVKWFKPDGDSIDNIASIPRLCLCISIPEGGSMSLKEYCFNNSIVFY